jgi:hypothetical protein
MKLRLAPQGSEFNEKPEVESCKLGSQIECQRADIPVNWKVRKHMTKKEIVVLVLRLSSLAFIFYTLNRAAITLTDWQKTANAGLMIGLIMVIVPLIIAVFTWLFAYQLANIFVPTVTEEPSESRWEREQIEATAFTIIGLFILTYAIPDTFYWLSFLYQSSMLNIEVTLLGPEFVAPIFTTAIELIIGFWLLLGAKGLAEFLKKVRVAGKK